MSRRVADLTSLRGRVALITGGLGHVGRAVAEAYAECGADLALVDLTPDTDGVADTLAREHGIRAVAYRVDLTDEGARAAIPGRVVADLGRLDVLVNNAAFVGTSGSTGWAAPFEEQTPGPWGEALRVNLDAPFFLAQAAAPHLAASGHGAIINVLSIYGLVGPQWEIYRDTGLANPAGYAASKGALLQMTRWLATTLAPGVRVNAISPGGIERGQPADFVARYAERTPLGRMAREEDLVGAFVYLASDLSEYVTGQNLVVDGGWSAW